MKGFRKGNHPVFETPLKDIVLIGGTSFKVRSRDARGKPTSFYPHSIFITIEILFRISLHNAIKNIKKLRHVNYKEKLRSILAKCRRRKTTRI